MVNVSKNQYHTWIVWDKSTSFFEFLGLSKVNLVFHGFGGPKGSNDR